LGEIVDGKTLGDLLSSEHKDHFYIMHLSYGSDKNERERLWKYATDKNMIGLDLPDVVTKDWVTLSESERQATPRNWIRQFDLFCREMHVGDYVVILNGIYSVLGIAKITEPRHRFDPTLSGKKNNGFFDHIREKVDWIKKYPYDGCPLPQPLTFDNTLERVTSRSRSLRWKILAMLDP
jgi:hypothetical protein